MPGSTALRPPRASSPAAARTKASENRLTQSRNELEGKYLMIARLELIVSISFIKIPARAPNRVETRGKRFISSKEIRSHADRGPAHALVTNGEVLPRRRLRERWRATRQGEVRVELLSPQSTRSPRTWLRKSPHCSAAFLAALTASSPIRLWQNASVWPRVPQ